ncbi:transcription elongation factor [Thermosphaera chiliense]|uniref:Transcription elongation factor n=1 Tax=Thermosphaera chiliense TaxID=3402707 RepID=A0A7M1UT80_9CREN|nr:transcription elongation factor [Thermosphaera aggregans]QOR94837.1 transcription elongation factor [Thermosphaera aggregans]
MKYPLDRICVKSGILCPSCQRKVETGVVDIDEVKVMKALMDIEEKHKVLRNGEYVKSFMAGDQFILILRDGVEQAELEEVSKHLSRELDAKVKIIVETGDMRRLIEQVISPASLLGVNQVWLPDGTEIVNVRVPRRDRRFLEKNRTTFEELIAKLTGRKARIVFE